ncbi:MAG: Chaperone protein DnaK [Myxococcota bacterium]|nr:Chaperone protein DnaK [Myxococcota bacterium]
MSDVVLGIDLGTSYSCVSIIENGQPKVIPNEWGEATHASVVSFMEDGRVIVGNEAKRRILLDPEHTVFSAKRLIGRFFFSEEVKKAQSFCPYEIVEGPNSSVRIRVYNNTYSLPEISAMILKELKSIAENYLGYPANKAVVTVPAYFNDNQRQATKDAGKIAGLDVLRIINEPTSAALAYGFGAQEGASKKVVIYDLGGGTFDVSVLDISGDVFQVLGTAGDTYLGGDDFDLRVMGWLAEQFLAKTGIDLRQDKITLQKLKDAAERAKIAMSSKDATDIVIPKVCRGPDGREYDLAERMTSQKFTELTFELIQKTFRVVDEAVRAAGVNVRGVDDIIMVGGPTRLPLVRNSVEHYFGKAPLTNVDPDLVVSMGAAIQGGALVETTRAAVLLDVTPLTLQIATVGGYCEPIIPKNTPLPVEKTRTFTTSRDFQDKVRIRVHQGESRRSDENELLGEFEFSGFRIAPRGEVTIEVVFEIDTDGIVNVSAHDVETGQRQSTTISLSSGLSKEELASSVERAKGVQMERGRGGDRDLPAAT